MSACVNADSLINNTISSLICYVQGALQGRENILIVPLMTQSRKLIDSQREKKDKLKEEG